MQTVDKIFNN